MPVYEYKCQQHGIFYGLATMDDSDKPSNCTECGVASPRIIMIAPEFLDMAPDLKNAHATNERSRHEPVYSTKDRRESDTEHKSGCGCDAQKPTKSIMMYTAAGEKMFPSMRPWMLSH
jgi:putative FmdB family regulatory protein